MKNKWNALSRLFPLGWPWENEVLLTVCAWGLSALISLALFTWRFNESLDALYEHVRGELVLIPGSQVPPYPQVLGTALLFFALTALCLALLACIHFFWHRWGARSDYLMRRLPRRWELEKRCLSGSALLLVCTGLIAAAMFWICFNWYLSATPAGHLPPDIWAATGG